MKRKELIGQTFDRLTVIDIGPRSKVLCRCRCGTIKNIRAYDAMVGKVKSCGCLHRENSQQAARKMSENNVTHGHTAGGPTTEYSPRHAALEYAKTNYWLRGHPEEQTIHVRLIGGEVRIFTVEAEVDISFYASEKHENGTGA